MAHASGQRQSLFRAADRRGHSGKGPTVLGVGKLGINLVNVANRLINGLGI